ncbi:hypothetical protein [Halorubellus sp. PRR65]|uniref:hypothetical protein n=1 Tax=Halorubellus sp. PRR65 TaxID=3098148 RepID=UPI002B25BB58|nr:hypothetical protein [Halorubellus sp. PRR65]
MSTEPDDETLVDLHDIVRDLPAVALATLAAGVTVLIVPFTYAIAYAPPVETLGLLGSALPDSEAATRTHFYQHAFAHDGVELAPLFLAAFALVAVLCVRADDRRRRPVVLALAAGAAVAVGYALVGTVGVWVLPPLDLDGPGTAALHSNVAAAAVGSLVLAVVAAAGTALGVLAVDATTGGAS